MPAAMVSSGYPKAGPAFVRHPNKKRFQPQRMPFAAGRNGGTRPGLSRVLPATLPHAAHKRPGLSLAGHCKIWVDAVDRLTPQVDRSVELARGRDMKELTGPSPIRWDKQSVAILTRRSLDAAKDSR